MANSRTSSTASWITVVIVLFAAATGWFAGVYRDTFAACVTPLLQHVQKAAVRALDGFLALAQANPDHGKPQVAKVRAKAFIARLVKRERPLLSASWRMCPST